MSKLSDHQIMAMIEGLESTVSRGLRPRAQAATVRSGREAAKKLIAYRAELAERTKTGQVVRNATSEVISFQQTNNTKPDNLSGFRETMSQPKNELTIAGEHIAEQSEGRQEALLALGAWIGRGQAFGMIGARASAAQAQCLQRVRESGDYKQLGLTWEQFCIQHVGIERKTVERIIASYEEFGASYFALSSIMRISPNTYRLIAGAVDETTVEIDGEKIPITKVNAARIAEAVASLAKTIDKKDELLAERKRDSDKLRSERNSATKAADRERQAFLEYKRKEAEMFPNAGENYTLMLRAQSSFDMAMRQITTVGNRELDADDQGRFIGLCEYMYRQLIQASNAARERFGQGWNMADPIDMLSLDQVAPNARNLMAEYVEPHVAANKK